MKRISLLTSAASLAFSGVVFGPADLSGNGSSFLPKPMFSPETGHGSGIATKTKMVGGNIDASGLTGGMTHVSTFGEHDHGDTSAHLRC